jgi:tetratricopeptide (TPR) repeat protein
MGHFELASADYRAALAIDESVEAYLRSADLLERMGKLDDAAKVLHQGVKRMGGVTIRRSLIDVERARGHWEDALACLDKTMKQADIKTTWLLLRAEIRVEQHRPTDARRDRIHALDEANRLLRKRRSALALRDRARALMSLNRYEEAIHDLKAARKKSPTLIEIHQLLAKAKSLKGGSR